MRNMPIWMDQLEECHYRRPESRAKQLKICYQLLLLSCKNINNINAPHLCTIDIHTFSFIVHKV